MDDQRAASGTDVFIVDNSDSDWKVLNYLREWAQLSQSVDIAKTIELQAEIDRVIAAAGGFPAAFQ